MVRKQWWILVRILNFIGMAVLSNNSMDINERFKELIDEAMEMECPQNNSK